MYTNKLIQPQAIESARIGNECLQMDELAHFIPSVQRICNSEELQNGSTTIQPKSEPTFFDGLVGVSAYTLHDLFNLPEEEFPFVVEGLLPAGGSSMLVGKPKLGKSTLARVALVRVARGEPFLGRQTIQGPVVYIALEDKKEEVSKHLKLLGAANGDPIQIVNEIQPGQYAEVLNRIKSARPRLVVIDTMAKFMNVRKMNDYGAVNEPLRELHDAARKCGTHLMLIHHTRKSASDEAVDDILGSSAFGGGVDTVLIMRRKGEARTISSEQRIGESMDETLLQFESLKRSVALGTSASELQRREKEQVQFELEERIIGFINANPGSLEKEILDGGRGNGSAKNDVLRRLLNTHIRREGMGRANAPYRYFSDVPVEAKG